MSSTNEATFKCAICGQRYLSEALRNLPKKGGEGKTLWASCLRCEGTKFIRVFAGDEEDL